MEEENVRESEPWQKAISRYDFRPDDSRYALVPVKAKPASTRRMLPPMASMFFPSGVSMRNVRLTPSVPMNKTDKKARHHLVSGFFQNTKTNAAAPMATIQFQGDGRNQMTIASTIAAKPAIMATFQCGVVCS